MKKDEEREVPDPWESIEEVLEVVPEVLEVFLEVSYIDYSSVLVYDYY